MNNDTTHARQLDSKAPYVITIGRQFGSGGRELGKKLAERFGIDYYDKKLLLEAAGRAGMNPDVFVENDERMPRLLGSSVGFSMGYGQLPWYNGPALMTDSIYNALADVMEHLADSRPCIIVGRSADYVLRHHPAAKVSVFVHAPMEERVRRIVARSKDIKEKNAARILAEKTDKGRAAYYNFYTDKKWGDSASYDITFDSSVLSMDALCDILALYIRERFGIEPVRK